MTNIAILGDSHINTKCSSRVDDYLYTCINKFTEVANTVGRNGHIIILGDMFHRPNVPASAIVSFLNLLNSFKRNNIQVHTILGNHDVFNYRENSLPNTNLGILQAAGVLNVILPDNPVRIDNINFYTSYVDLDKCKQHLQSLEVDCSEINILLLHQHIDGVHAGITYDEINNLKGIKYILFGHEHSPMNNLFETINDKQLWRLGSILRNTSDLFNLNRIPMYLIINTEDINNFGICSFDCAKPGKDVFSHDAYNKTNLKKQRFIQSIDEVLDRYNNVSIRPMLTMYNILTEINTPKTNLDYLESVHTRIGKEFR